MACRFAYSDLPPDNFRLLYLNGLDEGDGLKCTLKDVPLDSAPAYDAVSYSWNNEQPSIPIICNDKQLFITASLHFALRTFYSIDQPRPVWADAICINQTNEVEKARQVPLMGEYYTKAQTVLVWLGSSGTCTNLVLDGIEALNGSLSIIERPILITNEVLQSYGLPVETHPLWRGIGEIFARNWFQRLWIVQEVALANHIVVFCGSKSTGWHELSSLADHIGRVGITTLARGNVDVDPSKTDGFDAMMVPNFIRDYRSQGRSYPLTRLCHFARSRNTSEPIDKVYAVLGLTDEAVRKQIKVDYSQESRQNFWKAYVNLGAVSLQEDPDLFLLQIASSRERPLELPSWCPNLDSTSDAIMLPRGFYKAGGIAVEDDQRPYLGIASGSTGINLRGLYIDVVTEVVDSSWRWDLEVTQQEGPEGCAARGFEWMNACRALSSRVLQTPDSIPEQLIRTLIANILHHPSAYAPGLLELQESVSVATIYLQAVRDVGSLASQYMTQPEMLCAQRYLRALNMACAGRRFFATKRGFLGIGPLQTQAGDLAYIFKGAQVPFLFRQEQTRDCFKLVGEAYVHGLMDGGAFDQGQEEHQTETIHTIV
jgi:hypothetical protein